MKKDFKFPPVVSTSAVVPSVPALPGGGVPASAPEPEPENGAVSVQGYEIAPQEVPPPPPVEKERTQSQTRDEDAEEDVGPTVEVDLS